VSAVRERPVQRYSDVFGCGAEGQGFVVEVDVQLTFGFLVVEMEDCHCFDTIVDESLEDFKGDTQQRYRTVALWVPQWILWLRVATTSALLQIFGILSWRMQELRKSQNQDLRPDLAWSINSGKMESNPGDFTLSKLFRP